MLYSFFWAIPQHLNFFMCQYFGTLCSIFICHVNKNNWDEIARVFIQVQV